MSSASRHQLNRIDQTLLALVNERARLCMELALAERERAAPVSDLLRRNEGPLHAQDVRALFAAVEAACARCVVGPAPFRERGADS